MRFGDRRAVLAPLCCLTLLLALAVPAVHADALDLLQDNTDGEVGIYLKQVDGPVLESFREKKAFEGASTNKTMIHTHAMLEVQDGTATLDELIPVALDMSGSCPLGTGVVMETLEDALRLMMQPSDNARTQAIRDRFGDAAINDTMQALGMSDSLLNPMQTLGCGDEALEFPNELTAADLGLLYEQVLTGFLDEATRGQMFDLMLNQSNSFYIDALVNQEALSAGLTAGETLSFKSQIRMAHKGGSYTLVPAEGPAQEYRSLGGTIELPFACEGESRQFAYVAFVNDATDLDTQGSGSDLNIFDVGRELLRPLIGEALDSALCDRAPVVTAPAPVTLECNTTGGVAGDDPQIQGWLGLASAVDECDEVEVVHDAPAFFPSSCAPGLTTGVTFSATDSCGSEGLAFSSVSVQDTTPPALIVPADQVVECTSPEGAEVTVVAAGDDVCNDVFFNNSRTGATNDASGTYPLGETTVAWDARDDCDNHSCGWTSITVEDTTPPLVSCGVARDEIWPPNHQFEDVGLTYEVTDACDLDPEVEVTVTSDEDPFTAPGAGGRIHCPDALVCGDTVQLRAERSALGNGRVYVITVTATDASGNVGQCQVAVGVPLNQGIGGPPIDTGQEFDAEVCNVTDLGGGPGNGVGPPHDPGSGVAHGAPAEDEDPSSRGRKTRRRGRGE